MRTTLSLLTIGALALTSACMTSTSRFRTADGEAAPTYTRMDSVWKPAPVRCGGDVFYLVDSPNEGLTGTRLRKQAPPEVVDLTVDTFCERVHEADTRTADRD